MFFKLSNALNTHLILMVPEDVCWRLGTELDDACQIYGAAFVHIEIGSAQDRGCWHCNRALALYMSHK